MKGTLIYFVLIGGAGSGGGERRMLREHDRINIGLPLSLQSILDDGNNCRLLKTKQVAGWRSPPITFVRRLTVATVIATTAFTQYNYESARDDCRHPRSAFVQDLIYSQSVVT